MTDRNFTRSRRLRMMIPTDRQIRALHERHAPSAAVFDLVHTHCAIVCAVAEDLITRHDLAVDMALVRAGCLLHDIGVYGLYGPDGEFDGTGYIRHGVLGHELLADLGFPEILCRFCSHHTGVGLTRDDVVRQQLPLPEGDYLAETDEECLVMYADKFHSKSSPPVFLTATSYAARVGRFGADKAAAFEAMVRRFGEPDLSRLAGHHGHAVV